ncbi:MAG: hypothetical protein R3F50_01545 [Gammaproteobacteria bacterium]|jgi:predicted acetyltransferase
MRKKYKVVRADRSHDPVLRNLFEFYLHDMAEWFQVDQLPGGNYGHSTEPYWVEGHDVYLLYTGETPVGFALVGPSDQWLPGAAGNDMNEFFVVRRHRGTGASYEFASCVWHHHPGQWLVRVLQSNLPALRFWGKAVAEFSQAQFEEAVHEKNGRRWSHFTFSSSGA